MPAIKLHPQLVLKRHKGYIVKDVRAQNAKGLIIKTNITVFGKNKLNKKTHEIKDKFKNVKEAIAYIDTLKIT